MHTACPPGVEDSRKCPLPALLQDAYLPQRLFDKLMYMYVTHVCDYVHVKCSQERPCKFALCTSSPSIRTSIETPQLHQMFL